MSTPRALQRLVLPVDGDPDVLSLYVEAGEAPSSNVQQHVAPAEQHPGRVLTRSRLRVPAGERVSFATYFNAFPAGYWQRWTTVDAVHLIVRVSGAARVGVYRSSSSGSSERVESARSTGEEQATLQFTLPLTRFIDGGWYWFDVQAGDDDVVVEGADWRPEPSTAWEEPTQPGTVTLAVTTYNRPAYLLDLLRQLIAAGEALEVVDEVLVVDQGTDRVRAQAALPELEAALGGRLRIIEQPNVGGSGGFARGMHETLAAGRSRYVLLMDDDVACEPESILRAVTFADHCKRPTLVGGQMFNMYAPSRLQHFGEVVRPWRYHYTAADGVPAEHDFRTDGLRATTWMHRRVDVTYNAWWMCLIPIEVVKSIGLALPVFIKWDDAEYGVRAGAAGYPTVTMPGVAVWHMPFGEKDDVLDWQAYFHQRNRFVAALLHSPYPRGGRLVRDSLYQQVRHLLALQYSVADLRVRALEDVLEGPGNLHAMLATKLPEVRSVRAGYADSTTTKDPDDFPAPGSERLGKDRQGGPPTGRVANLLSAATIGLKHLRPVAPSALDRPQAAIAARDAHWWKLAQVDSALVSTLDGTSVAWYRRDRDRYVDLLRRSVRLHERILTEWPELSARYRESSADIVSATTWAETFARLDEAAAEPRT